MKVFTSDMIHEETAIEKAERIWEEKGTNIIFGIDPDEKTWETAMAYSVGPEDYYMDQIKEASPYIAGIKPNLAFWEKTPERRQIMMNIMKRAKAELNMITVLDAKRGDIMNTQEAWADADIANFNPDFVTLHSYMGSDSITPYFKKSNTTCAFVMCCNSNPPSQEIQAQYEANGLTVYENMALRVRGWDKDQVSDRIGLVVGSTMPAEMENIRRLEKEHGLTPSLILAPGFGRQGGKLDFVKFAGKKCLYPVSSGILNPKYYPEGVTTLAGAAKYWRDTINTEIKKHEGFEQDDVKAYVTKGLIEGGFVKFAKSEDLIQDGFFLASGKKIIKEKGIILPESKEQKVEELRKLVKEGILSKEKNFSEVFIALRDVLGTTNFKLSQLFGYLYTKKVKDSGVKPDFVVAVPYGAVDQAIHVRKALGVPAFIPRKEGDLTHDAIVGDRGDLKGKRGIIVEDLATKGGSSLDTVNLLRNNGFVIDDVFVFLDRLEGAAKNLKEAQVNLHSVIDMDYLKHLIRRDSSLQIDPGVKDIFLNR